MDSDDIIDETNGRKLWELARLSVPENLLGFVIKVHCPSAGADGQFDVTAVDHCKLFRNRPDLRFDHRIHEQILGAINAVKGDVAFTDLFVVHAGADRTPEGLWRKLKRDMRLLKKDLREKPDHPFVLFNLGMTYADAHKHRKAIQALERSIEVASPNESHLRKAYALLVSSYVGANRPREARDACQRGRELFPKDPELLFRQAILLHAAGKLAEAASAYLGALANEDQKHFSSIDVGIVGYKSRQNLTVVYTAMGDRDKAEEQWRLITQEVPAYREGWRGLGNSMLARGDHEAATTLARQLTSHPSESWRTCRDDEADDTASACFRMVGERPGFDECSVQSAK